MNSVERLWNLGLKPLFSDRNAALVFAAFEASRTAPADFVDWPLMQETYWASTRADPQRRERRMAECLVHERVPWSAFTEVVTRTAACKATVRGVLAAAGVATPVVVRPDWYF